MPCPDTPGSRLARALRVLRARRAFTAGTRRRLWRRLAAHARNGLPVYMAFEHYHRQACRDHSPLRHIYARALRCRDAGTPLASAFRGCASREEVMLIAAGERSGDLANGFSMAAGLLADREVLARAVRGSLAYPCFLIIVAAAMLVMTSRLIIPQLGLVLDPSQWTGAAAFLRDLASFTNSRAGAAALMAFLGGIGLMAWSLPRWTGRIRRLVDGVGPWALYRAMKGATWLLSLATLMRSGLQVRQVLEQSLRDPDTGPWLAERVRAVAAQYSWGKNLGRALHDAGYDFPSREACDDLLTYARLPNMEEHLADIARDQMDLAVEDIRLRLRRLNVTLLLLVFGLILLTIYGVFSFQQQFAATM